MPRRSTQFGFSIIEMMVVLVIILVLLVLLSAPLFDTATRAAWTATCSSNLHQVGVAKSAFRAEHKYRELEAGNWNLLRDQYLQGNKDVLVCPEGELGIGNIEQTLQIALWYRHLNPDREQKIDEAHAFANLDAGGFRVVKVSESQIASGISTQNGQNFFSRNPTYLGYDEGSTPNAWGYWYNHDGGSGGDRDYDDSRIRVSVNGALATVDVWTEAAMINAGYITWLVRKDNHQNLLPGGDAGNIPNAWTSVDLALNESTYGMNWNTPKLPTGGSEKIFAIDYSEPIVRLDTWDRWHDSLGVPAFARHPGNKVNAVRVDGSVYSADPWEIDPQLVTNEEKYWQP
jgi:prepilin-type N-terminal cleavage/methylation domain-containing protein